MEAPTIDNRPMLLDVPGTPNGGNELTPIRAVMRYKWSILAFATAVAIAVYAGLSTVQPLYNSSASVMIDPRQVQLLGQQSTLLANQDPNESWTRTQMEVLNSPRLAVKVVHTLGLTQNPLFQDCTEPEGFAGKLRAMLPGAPPPSCQPSEEAAVKTLLAGVMKFSNDRGSFIIKTTAMTPDPELSARVANAYAVAYVDWQRSVPQGVAEKADEQLTPYLQQMRARVQAANTAVERHRQTYGLIPLRKGDSSQTLRSQSLGEANSELSVADNQLADKQSLLQQVQRLQRGGGPVEAIPPALASPVIQVLLQKQAELAGTLDELRTRYMPGTQPVVSAQTLLSRNQAQIRAEIGKTVASLSSEVAALTARRATVAARVADLQAQVATDSHNDVVLQDLQRDAQAEISAYEAMLVRLKQIGAERLVQRGEAQVVVEAIPPDFPSYPRKRMMVAGAFLGSLCIGGGIALAGSFLSRRFRNAEHIEDETGLRVLGLFLESRGRPPQDLVADMPFSFGADSVRSVLAQLCGSRPPGGEPLGKVVMVTSALPGEGKTSFSVALGRCAAQSGMSVFLLDCDLRRPAVEKAILGRRAATGEGVSVRPSSPAELIASAGQDERSGLRYLPLSHYASSPHGMLGWHGLPELLDQLRDRYDLIILDAPPVLAVSDAVQLGPLADEVVAMIDWRKTPRPAVVAAIRALRRAGMPVSGAVMSKVDLRRYEKASAGNVPFLRYDRRYHKALTGV